jgi:TolA-binding protein
MVFPFKMTSSSTMGEFNASMGKNCCETSVSTKASVDSSEATSKNPPGLSRKRVVDETLLSPDEAEKLLIRRAYNRDCASRARKRGKQLVAQLEAQVKELQEDKDELRRSLISKEKQINLLEKQNQSLLLKQMISDRDRNALTIANSGAFLPFSLSQGNAVLSGGTTGGYGLLGASALRSMPGQNRFN